MAASASAQVIEAPITGDAAVDTAYKDFIELNGSTPSYAFDKDATIKVDSSVNTPLQFTANGNTYDVAAGIAAMSTKATYLYLSPNDSTLSIDVTAHGDAIGAGMLQTGAQQAIFTTNGKVANYNITVTGADDNTKKSYGIWRSMINTNNKGMFINSNKGDYSSKKVNIDIKNANGGYGIAASAPEGVDNLASNASAIWIYGNVNVNVSENKKAADLLDNSAGLYVNLKDSKINIDGYADLNVAGNGIVVNAADGQASVTVTKGGRINVLASEDGSDRYAIYNQGGRVYYGAATLAGLNNYRGPVIQGNRTQIDGDVYVGDSSAGVLWIGATGADSYLKGVIKEAGEFSNVGMALNDGAVWYNQAANKGNVGTDTVFNKISGTNGLIYQNALSGKVTIDSLESNALNIAYEHDKTTPEKILGGDVTIVKAENKSELNVFTDYDSNMNTDASREAVLNALAKKIYYTGYKTGEDNISGTVSIAEGLTTRSAKKYFADMSFDKTTGQGYCAKDTTVQEFTKPDAQKETEFTKAILGDRSNKKYYEDAGVYVNGKYNFTADTTMNVENNSQVAGTWLWATAAGIYSGYNQENVNLDLNGKKLNINLVTDQDTAGIAAIAANSKVEIDNAGPMSVYAESTKGSNVATLFVNGGGQLTIHNGDGDLEKKVLTARASASYKNNGAVIKTMNGKKGVTSKITIDGLVDVLADGVNSNEAVSAVASTIDIGGGRIEAANGAWAAIRAYGEFVSPNYGVVNFNVLKDEDGNAIGAGDNRAVVIGDVVTNGGMGTKGRISLGMKGENSYWEGNYADTRGYGVTQGQLGAVNLFMEDGAHWKGFGNGSMNVKLDGAKTNWYGFSISDGMQLSLKNGATWYNAITAEQVDQSSKHTDAKIGWLTSDNGFIDMTGSRVFTAKSSSLNGGTTADGSSSITESEHGITGNVVVNNYSGNATVIYKHTKTNDGIDVIGGNFTIKNATEGSKITLSTDNNGIDTSNPDDVQGTLNQLANKLYYLGAIDGAESNLDGYVQIAEGLTSSSAALKLGDVEFSGEDGKGSLAAGSVVTPDSKKNPAVIYGDKETAMMKGAKTAMVSNALVWRAENNDLMKRMGDLRLSEGESGIWAKYYGGKYSMDGQNTNMSVRYNAYQVGYDKEVADGWKAGVALSYDDGSSSYGTGHADLKNTSLGLYGTWTGEDGQYVDLIAKYSRLENEYDVRNLYGHKLSGDYKTWGASLSAEYGKRFEGKNGMYVDPSVELTLGRVAGKDYKAASDYLDAFGKAKDLYVHQDAFTSLIGRVGVRLGQKLDNASYFVKLAAAHEFNGDFDSSYHVEGEPDGSTSISFSDTWFEAQLGGSVKLNDNSMVYASFERSFGGDVEQKWRVDAGLRWSF